MPFGRMAALTSINGQEGIEGSVREVDLLHYQSISRASLLCSADDTASRHRYTAHNVENADGTEIFQRT
jgi:hypothetical protein